MSSSNDVELDNDIGRPRQHYFFGVYPEKTETYSTNGTATTEGHEFVKHVSERNPLSPFKNKTSALRVSVNVAFSPN